MARQPPEVQRYTNRTQAWSPHSCPRQEHPAGFMFLIKQQLNASKEETDCEKFTKSSSTSKPIYSGNFIGGQRG